MSQFFGCIALNTQINITDVTSQMTNSMSFFQGDAIGIYQTNQVFICNKFLFNTSESVNTTSICQNERYIMAASCRIDNREEIAKKVNINEPLKASDYEYILAAYTFYEQECVKHLIGDFSFVVWDKQKQILFMAKDHLGIKPLFYTLQNENLFFSTDLNAFLRISNLNTEYSKPYLASMICGEIIQTEVSPEFTCYEHILRLKPAHRLLFNKNKVEINEYWQLKPQQNLKLNSKKEYFDEFFRLFEQSVASRLRTNDKIGVELSGGLDSSAIACMIGHISKKEKFDLDKLLTFSLVHSKFSKELENREDEEPFQEIVQRWIGIKSENIIKNFTHPFSSFWDEYKYGFKVHGGFSKVNFTWQKPIYEGLMNKECRIKLSGFVGDEFVSNSGTHWFYDGLYQFDIRFMWKFLSKNTIVNLKAIIRYYLLRFSIFRINAKIKFDTNYLSPQFKNLTLKRTYKMSYVNHKSFLTSFISRPYTTLRFETETLHALQHNSECRYPMADIRLLEFILSIPFELWEPKQMKRMLFRNSLQLILPPDILKRDDKTGAVLPYFQEKNMLFLAELNEIQIVDNCKETAFINTEKINSKRNNISKFKREIEITSLLNVIFLKKILSTNWV
jgi:asparagine synthase (glutamine-hydrolysing)